jgi:thioredoxin-related protein
MKITFQSILAAAVLAGAAPVIADIDDSSWRYGPTEAWFVNWDKALAEAKKTGKALFLLNTGSDWCGWCKRLKADVLDKPEFAEFAEKNLVLVYLDSPSRNPLGKEQRAHNRLVTKSLPFGGGVPHVLVMNAKGEKLGSIGGGGMKVEPYLEKLRGILSERGEAVKGQNAQRLFTDGYEKTADAIAAARAALPPVTTNDFKAVLTGVAVVDGKRRNRHNEAVFMPPETKLEVPYGKTALFRVEYDFPEGYGARVWVRDSWPREERRNSYYFGSNPSGLYNGKGTAYGFLSLLDRGKTCNLASVKISTNTDPELDDYPHGWTIATVPVNLHFKEKEESSGSDEADNAPAVSKSVPNGWIEDFEEAKKQAAKEGKLILIDFSGSDWCGWCKKMDEEVFAQAKFVKEASKKFVLVMIDNPRDKSILSSLARRQNSELKEKFSVSGYPTVVIANPKGERVGGHSGYRRGGPKGYIKYLRELTRGVKWPSKAK